MQLLIGKAKPVLNIFIFRVHLFLEFNGLVLFLFFCGSRDSTRRNPVIAFPPGTGKPGYRRRDSLAGKFIMSLWCLEL